MRLSLIVVLLLAGSHSYAQDTPAIVTPTKNGLAEGVSTYTSPDGTRVEITWRQGRKHGPFRKLTADGSVLESGNYVRGQRAGEWNVFDESGNTIGSGRYLLGIPNGKHERRDIVGGKITIVESTNYVLGIKHGPAIVNDESFGGIAEGYHAWNKPHGIFRSGKSEIRYMCGFADPRNIVRRRMDILCNVPDQLQLHLPAPKKGSSAKPALSKSQRVSLCTGQALLKIPVLVNQTPLHCPKPVRANQAERTYERFVRDLYRAEDVVREVQENFLYGGFQSAFFTQTIRRGGKRATHRKLFGRIDFYEAGDVEWLYDSDRACHFSLRPDAGQVVAAKARPKLRATRPIADFALAPVSALAFAGEKTLASYKAVFTDRQSKALGIELTAKSPTSKIERIKVRVALDHNRRRLTLQSVELHMRSGDSVLTELRGLSYSEPPEGHEDNARATFPPGSEDFQVVPAKKLGCKTQIW